MDTTICRLTVYFEDPFWVGLYERESGGWYEACKLTFGAEPKDYEVYDLLMRQWRRMRFSPPVAAEQRRMQIRSPKRIQREIQRALERPAMSTKAQQALAAQREQGKAVRRVRMREQKAQETQDRYQKHQQKRREKHRGH